MHLSDKARNIHDQVTAEGTKLGDLKKLAKEIKRDHTLAMELWSTGDFMARRLAVLIMDKKQLDQELVDQLCSGMEAMGPPYSTQLAEWFMANQLTKDKKLIALMLSWQNSPSPIQRRTFWYYQARLRWTGQTPPDNTEALLAAIETDMAKEVPEVQWAMNFTAGWIGVFDEAHRNQCINIGEQLGLYKDEVVAKNCTPNYLPRFIEIEVGKRSK